MKIAKWSVQSSVASTWYDDEQTPSIFLTDITKRHWCCFTAQKLYFVELKIVDKFTNIELFCQHIQLFRLGTQLSIVNWELLTNLTSMVMIFLYQHIFDVQHKNRAITNNVVNNIFLFPNTPVQLTLNVTCL